MLLFSTILFALLFARVVWPLPLGVAWRLGLGVLLALAAFKFQLTRLLGGPMFFAPQLPAWLQLFLCWLYAIVFLLFFLVALSELAQLFPWMCGKGAPARTHGIINAALVAVALVLATWGILRGNATPRLRRVTLEFDNLPEKADGMTIAFLADIHADVVTRSPRVEKMAALANGQNADLVVLVGDFVDGRVGKVASELEPLRSLSAPLGVFGVPGNHEYYSGLDEWMEHLRSLGITMLQNESAVLGNGVILAGVTDPASRHVGGELPDVRKALAGTPADSFKILLAHQPSLAAEAASEGVDLQLSGHTHGGMILGIDRLVGFFNDGFYSGLYTVGERMKLYVTNGAGIWNGFPVRIGHEAEVILLQLKRTPAQ